VCYGVRRDLSDLSFESLEPSFARDICVGNIVHLEENVRVGFLRTDSQEPLIWLSAAPPINIPWVVTVAHGPQPNDFVPMTTRMNTLPIRGSARALGL
jgi:hypothetical protein